MATETRATANTTLAARLKKLMHDRRLSLRDVEAMAGDDIAVSTIHRAANAERDLRISTVVALARALGTSVDYLVGMSGPPTPPDPDAHAVVPLLPAPPTGDAEVRADDDWITVPRTALRGRDPDYALWVPPDEGNVPGLAEGDILVVSATAAPSDRSLIVVRTADEPAGYAVRQYRQIDDIILQQTLDGDLHRLAQADIIGVGVWVCHWM